MPVGIDKVASLVPQGLLEVFQRVCAHKKAIFIEADIGVMQDGHTI